MNAHQVRELVRRSIEDVWAHSDSAALAELYASDVVDHHPMPGQAPGIAGLVEVMDAFTTSFSGITMQLHAVLVDEVDGEHGTDRWTLQATHSGEFLGVPATGRTIEISGMDVVRVSGGLITEVWHTEDLASALRQVTTPSHQETP